MRQRYAVATVVVLLLNALFSGVVLRVWPRFDARITGDSLALAFAVLSIVAIVAVAAEWRAVMAAAFLLFVARTGSLLVFHPHVSFGRDEEEDLLLSFGSNYTVASPALEPLAAFLLGLMTWRMFDPFVRGPLARLRQLRPDRPATVAAIFLLLLDGLTGSGVERAFDGNDWLHFAAYLVCAAIAVSLILGILRTRTLGLAGAALYFAAPIVVETMRIGGLQLPLIAVLGLVLVHRAFGERPSLVTQRVWFASEP